MIREEKEYKESKKEKNKGDFWRTQKNKTPKIKEYENQEENLSKVAISQKTLHW